MGRELMRKPGKGKMVICIFIRQGLTDPIWNPELKLPYLIFWIGAMWNIYDMKTAVLMASIPAGVSV